MAVIEYKMHRQGNLLQVPDFVTDRGHMQSPINNSWIGWVPEDADWYVPDTLVRLTKEQFIARQVAIHAVRPFMKFESDGISLLPLGQASREMTNEEVLAEMSTWYDNFVAQNQPA
jgi:hypothetical protein